MENTKETNPTNSVRTFYIGTHHKNENLPYTICDETKHQHPSTNTTNLFVCSPFTK